MGSSKHPKRHQPQPPQERLTKADLVRLLAVNPQTAAEITAWIALVYSFAAPAIADLLERLETPPCGCHLVRVPDRPELHPRRRKFDQSLENDYNRGWSLMLCEHVAGAKDHGFVFWQWLVLAERGQTADPHARFVEPPALTRNQACRSRAARVDVLSQREHNQQILHDKSDPWLRDDERFGTSPHGSRQVLREMDARAAVGDDSGEDEGDYAGRSGPGDGAAFGGLLRMEDALYVTRVRYRMGPVIAALTDADLAVSLQYLIAEQTASFFPKTKTEMRRAYEAEIGRRALTGGDS